ncbi:coiled-coil-helix-coiled-coil-helix domain containing 3 [Haematobia irritans]|uniref:coiled-coil-helix-coiled-coil-helix domain containing 3 n=1 Tax=Haematobia irritans TaxID=7368 RepID=UPI003F4FC035
MGAAHSSEPRSVSMDNPTPAGVIDISDDVVNRLKKGISKQAKENARAQQSAPPPPQPEAKSPKASAAPPPPPTIVYQNPPPVIYAAPSGTTFSASDMRRQKEIELQQNDAMWKQRMANLEQTLKKTNAIMEKEYSTAVEDVRKRFATASPIHQLPPCQDLKAQVIACYRAHPGETLKCAEEVAAFRNCVNINRIKKLDAEEAADAAKKAPATGKAKAA